MTDTSAVDSNLYPMVSSALAKNMSKYKAMISKFMNKRQEPMYAMFPASRIAYGETDVKELLAALDLNLQECMQAIAPAYFFEIPDFNPRAVKSAVTEICACAVRYFYLKKDKRQLELALIYMAFSGNFYPSIHYKYFKVVEPRQYPHVVNYVVNEYMDGKYEIKATGSLIGAVTSLCNKLIETYGERLLSKKVMLDEDYVYFIQQMYTRVSSLVCKCANAYYECYHNKLYMTYQSDKIDGEGNEFRIAESDLSRAEMLAQKTMTILTTRDADFKTAKRSSNERVKTKEIMDLINKTVKNPDNLNKLQELIRLKLVLYMQDTGKPNIDDTIGFMSYAVTPSPNTANKDKLREKELTTELLASNADSYLRRSANKTTEILYRQSINTYIALMIIEAYKK